MSKTPYLNSDTVWTPTADNILGFCVTPSSNPASKPGFMRLRVNAQHVVERDATGTPHCLRCGRNLDEEYRAMEKREFNRNIKEV